MSQFQQAKKEKLSAKIALEGPAGHGKTYSALLLAHGFGGKTALIDTENRSSCLYAGLEFDPVNHPGEKFEFDVAHLSEPYAPERYVELILDAQRSGYQNIIIDSATHEWEGPGGILELSDTLKGANGNKFTVWAQLTPRHNRFVHTILQSPCNIISCFRAKTSYEIQQEERNGKTVNVPVKIGMKPITREGFDYENTVVFSLGVNAVAVATKDRTALYRGIAQPLRVEDDVKIMAYLRDGEDRTGQLREWIVKTWAEKVSPPLMGDEVGAACVEFARKLMHSQDISDIETMSADQIKILAAAINKRDKLVADFVQARTQQQPKTPTSPPGQPSQEPPQDHAQDTRTKTAIMKEVVDTAMAITGRDEAGAKGALFEFCKVKLGSTAKSLASLSKDQAAVVLGLVSEADESKNLFVEFVSAKLEE